MAARYCETKDVRFDIISFWDMPLARGLFPTKLSREIRLSGDGNAIKAYLDQNENDLCGKGDYAAAVP
ncbi:MAG: hypothetical protein K6B69_03030 [Lachnospiraceae bacterium]|nr:hypothetical protein [Lachnospiraceae bacterium]